MDMTTLMTTDVSYLDMEVFMNLISRRIISRNFNAWESPQNVIHHELNLRTHY